MRKPSKIILEKTKAQDWRMVARDTTYNGLSRQNYVVLDDKLPDLPSARLAHKRLKRYLHFAKLRELASNP